MRKYKERNNRTSQNKILKNKDYLPTQSEESSFLNEALFNEGREASLPVPVIKNKYFEMNPISSEEARKQLDLIDHDFYVFRNKQNNQLQVIYKRNHGGYGLIQSK